MHTGGESTCPKLAVLTLVSLLRFTLHRGKGFGERIVRISFDLFFIITGVPIALRLWVQRGVCIGNSLLRNVTDYVVEGRKAVIFVATLLFIVSLRRGPPCWIRLSDV